MISLPEQFSAATAVYLDSQLALFSTLNGRLIESVEKFIVLNVDLIKTSLQESEVATKQYLSIKDANDFLDLHTVHTKPMAEKIFAYSRDLAVIVTDTQAEFARVMKTQIAASNRKAQALMDKMSKNTPAESEQFTSIFGMAIDSANAGYEQMTKPTKHVIEAIVTNMNNAAISIAQANGKSTLHTNAKK